MFFGIPNFGDVVSSAAFWVLAFFSFRKLSQGKQSIGKPHLPGNLRALLWCYGIGLCVVGAGSAYFHWNPTPDTLLWDRLPMAWCFGTLMSVVLIERTETTNGFPLWILIVVASMLSVLNINMFFQDIRPYLVVQFGSIATILLLVAFFKPKYFSRKTLFFMVALYGSAKVFEKFDHQIYENIWIASGHSLKHIAAAIASNLIFFNQKNV